MVNKKNASARQVRACLIWIFEEMDDLVALADELLATQMTPDAVLLTDAEEAQGCVR
ncbi:MAG: hypothetical protein M3300_08295 [Actinomycetota bacterium]|nr:hypothetical protein [Actinomycetota bacterium]